MKSIDYLFHFTKSIENLKAILKEGFKPSYGIEQITNKTILVPMVSFSNILLRDVGGDEVINYGDFAICLSREWGISNNINPVIYTYDNGVLDNTLNTFLHNTLMLTPLKDFKENLKEISDNGIGPFSNKINVTNTSPEVIKIFDYLSMNYNGELCDLISNLGNVLYNANFSILTLTKPYKVKNGDGEEFIAYNDREWRKSYEELSIVYESNEKFEYWRNTPKPHFNEPQYRLTFSINDIKAIVVKDETDVAEIINFLKYSFGEYIIDELVHLKSLHIGTKKELIKIMD